MNISKRKEVFKMKIDGKIEVSGYLRTCDLYPGEAFAFEDDAENLFMVTDGEVFIHLETGETFYESDHGDRPVKRINAKIVIEG